ncbi:hypothetical protein PM082_013904 [Marasmius tenuissimus]|nr:hypothetical protein PM082_013904 [Marasmius tenuissimus]
MAPSTTSRLAARRQRRPHPYPIHQRFPPVDDADPLPEPIQADDVLGAAINLREYMFIVLLLVLRLFVAIFLHGNAIRALTENAA